MQNVIFQIRKKLSPFIGSGSDMAPDFENHSVDAASYRPDSHRFIRKIPLNNYEKLPKLVPISWL